MTDVQPLLIWEQERPTWCPHTDCEFLRRVQDALCGGKLPTPEPHHGDHNTHRMCQRDGDDGTVYDWQVNATDLDGFRWIFDAIDGKVTSWRSKRVVPEIGGDAEHGPTAETRESNEVNVTEGGGQRPEAGASESELNGQVSRSHPSPEPPTYTKDGLLYPEQPTTEPIDAQPGRDLEWDGTPPNENELKATWAQLPQCWQRKLRLEWDELAACRAEVEEWQEGFVAQARMMLQLTKENERLAEQKWNAHKEHCELTAQLDKAVAALEPKQVEVWLNQWYAPRESEPSERKFTRRAVRGSIREFAERMLAEIREEGPDDE